MPLLNFKKRFVPAIENGTKLQTIRAPRKNPIKVGDNLFLYVGARTKHARRIAEAICTEVLDITIKSTGVLIEGSDYGALSYTDQFNIGGLHYFAVSDGFTDWWDMREFFQETHKLPFTGHLIKYKLI